MSRKTAADPAEVVDQVLASMSKDLENKFQFLEEIDRKYEKWFQFELIYALHKHKDMKKVYGEWCRRCDRRKNVNKTKGYADVEFCLKNLSTKCYFSIEIKFHPFICNFKPIIDDLNKYLNYIKKNWDLRGIFLIYVCSPKWKKSTRNSRFLEKIDNEGLVRRYKIKSTNIEIISIGWVGKNITNHSELQKQYTEFSGKLNKLWQESVTGDND